MSERLMTAREVAEYLSLNEKKIYALAKRGDIPCTKVTGKWLFPKEQIDAWIAGSGGPGAQQETFEHVRIVGSHDPAIDLLASEVNDRFPRLTILAAHVGSLNGLEALLRNAAQMSGVHLLDPETGEYNIPHAQRILGALHPIVVHFALREQGLIVQKGNPTGVRGVEQIGTRGARLINRQEGSGTRVLLDLLLMRHGIDPGSITGYDDCASTHTEVATVIKGGSADVGLGLRTAAAAADLDFIPVTKERYDLVIPRSFFYTEPIQKCLEVLRSAHFKERIERLGGYDTTDTGTVLLW